MKEGSGKENRGERAAQTPPATAERLSRDLPIPPPRRGENECGRKKKRLQVTTPQGLPSIHPSILPAVSSFASVSFTRTEVSVLMRDLVALCASGKQPFTPCALINQGSGEAAFPFPRRVGPYPRKRKTQNPHSPTVLQNKITDAQLHANAARRRQVCAKRGGSNIGASGCPIKSLKTN